jgi:hypothetical protein
MGYTPLEGEDLAAWRSQLERFADDSDRDRELVELLVTTKAEPEDSPKRKRAINKIFEILHKDGGLYYLRKQIASDPDDFSNRQFHFYKVLNKEIHNFDPAFKEKKGSGMRLGLQNKLECYLNFICSRRFNETYTNSLEVPLNENSLDSLAKWAEEEPQDVSSTDVLQDIQDELQKSPDAHSYKPEKGDVMISYFLITERLHQARSEAIQKNSKKEKPDKQSERVTIATLEKIALEYDVDPAALVSDYYRHFRPFLASLWVDVMVKNASEDLQKLEKLNKAIAIDHKSILRGCHIRGYPKCNAQYLALEGCLFKKLVKEFEKFAQELLQQGMDKRTATAKRVFEFWQEKGKPAIARLVIDEKLFESLGL